jgi:hypothetical protein
MLQALDAMGVLAVAGSIPGVPALQVAAILAETGDPARFATSSSRRLAGSGVLFGSVTAERGRQVRAA